MSPEANISHGEDLGTPEKPRLTLVRTAAITGPSYAGKELLVKELSRRHGWRIYNGKGEFERRAGSESTRMRNDLATQRDFDRMQLERILSLTPEDAQLYETRLAGIILAEARDRRAQEINVNRRLRQTQDIPELGQIPAVSLLLWAEADVRYDRALEVALRGWRNQRERLGRGEALGESEKLIEEKPTRDSVIALVRRNQNQDVLDWSKLRQHKDYIKLESTSKQPFNPFSRELKRLNGGPVYDWWIDTSGKTPAEVADQFELEAQRYGVYITENPVPTTQAPASNLDNMGEPMGIGGISRSNGNNSQAAAY